MVWICTRQTRFSASHSWGLALTLAMPSKLIHSGEWGCNPRFPCVHILGFYNKFQNFVCCCIIEAFFLLLQIPGLVNVDFADVKAVMKDSGTAMLGVGVSSSKNRAEEAAEQATLAPLIGSSIQSATGVVYNITGGKDITLQEVNRVSQVLQIFLNFLFWVTSLVVCLAGGGRWERFSKLSFSSLADLVGEKNKEF